MNLECEQDRVKTRNLYEVMDDLKREQLVVARLDCTAEEKTEKNSLLTQIVNLKRAPYMQWHGRIKD